MKKAHWLALFLALGLLSLFAIVGWELAQPASAGRNPVAAQSPILGPFINIWTEATVENESPAVAYNSLHDEYLVVWWNDRGATRDIYARRVGSDGTLESWFAVAWGAGEKRWQPDVAYSPAQDEYLIVYTYEYSSNDYDLRAKRVKWDGSWMSTEFVINDDVDIQSYSAVAYNSQDDEYLVVYHNEWAGGLYDIAAQRVRASDGSLLSWANVATGAGEYREDPDVAYNPARNQYLIAYHYSKTGGTGPGILGKVAAANLAGVSGPPEIPIIDVGPGTKLGVAVATGPDEYLVVWTTLSDVYGRRVSGDGTPLGPAGGFPIATSTFGRFDMHYFPGVAYGAGYGYLVASEYWNIHSYDEGDVYGRYVMPGQDSATGEEFVIDDSLNRQTAPAVGCAPSGECLVVEQHNALAYPGSNYEIRGRFVMPHRVYLPLVLKNY